jgi:hypothetical protein
VGGEQRFFLEKARERKNGMKKSGVHLRHSFGSCTKILSQAPLIRVEELIALSRCCFVADVVHDMMDTNWPYLSA